jgi:hypothetical protein
MTWKVEDIERDWGATSPFPGLVVDAFEQVERILGREWIAAVRNRSGGQVQGPAPLLEVVSMGERLSVLETIDAPEPGCVGRLYRSRQVRAPESAA